MSFDLEPGRTLGLVGESGSGKSTTGKAVLGLIPFTGDVVIDGTAIAGLSPRAMKPVRRKAQMIFQDPYASLDPRMSVGAAIAEPLAIHEIGSTAERHDRVAALLRRVHLSPDHASRFRTNSQAASASASASPARSPSSLGSSWPTRASRRSTCRCAAGCST